MKKKYLLISVIIFSIIWLIDHIWSFSFFFLFVLFIIFVSNSFYFHYSSKNSVNMNSVNTPLPTYYAKVGSMFLLILLGFCYWALDNYINPSTQIFSNNDHHAVRVDGINIDYPNGFILAADNNQAFLDTVGFPGDAVIASVEDGGVRLRLKGVTRPLYRYYYDNKLRNNRQEIINYDESFVIGPSTPSFTLVNKANRRLKVTIEECNNKKHWFNFFQRSDSTIYWYQLDEQKPQKTTYSTYLNTGYDLDRIIPEIEGFDLIGLSLIRPKIFPIAKRKEMSDVLGGRYTFDIRTEAFQKGDIKAIECNGHTFELSALAKEEKYINIPFGQTIAFGYGEGRTEPLSFVASHENLSGIRLEFNCPFYRTLAKINEETLNTLYVTTTLSKGSEIVDPDLPDNILLFDFFHRLGNRHNMEPFYLTFYSGRTNEPLKMQLAIGKNISKDIQAGTPFSDIVVRSNQQQRNFGEKWIISVQNFRETTPFSQQKICIYLLLLTVLSIIVLNYGNRENQHIVTYSHVELSAYMLIICFMTLRLFLLWRMSVFPPVSSITNYELHNFFWQGDLWFSIYFFTVIFYIAIIIIKNSILKFNNYNLLFKIRSKVSKRESEESEGFISIRNIFADNFIKWFILVSFVLAIICILFPYLRRIFSIYLPVFSYFLGDMLLTARYGRTYKEDMDEQYDNISASHIRRLHVAPFIMTSFNMLFWSIVLFINDNGYGILFLTFGLIWTQLKLREIDLYTGRKGGKWITFLLLLIAILLVSYKYLFLLSISYPWIFILLCGIIAFIIILLVCRSLVGNFRYKIIWGISISSAMIVCLGAFLVAEFLVPGNHIEQRIRVHWSTPDAQLSSIGDSQSERKFLEASLNDWILSEYYNDGKDIKLIGDRGNGYFQLKPHSKLGAMWGAQTSDLSLSRYVIAEHGNGLPIALFLSFLLLLCIGISCSSYSRVTKGLLIQVPLLLFIQSLMIWMAVTRRFIFLGQDFPLISCNSKFTIPYTLTLLAIWICAMAYESLFVGIRTVDEDNRIKRSNLQNMSYFAILMGSVVGFFYFQQYFDDSKPGVYKLSGALEQLSKTLNEPIVDVSELQIEDYRLYNNTAKQGLLEDEDNDINEEGQDETQVFLYSINDLIDNWQAIVSNKNDTAYSRHHIADISNTHFVMKSFDAVYGKYIEKALSKSEDMRFTKLLYRHYIDNLSRRNSYDGILHMHRNRNTGRATLAVRTDYYNASLPNRPRYSWTGNIIENKRRLATNTHVNTANYKLARYPGNWFKDGQDVVILSRKKGNISIRSRNNEAPLNLVVDTISQSVRIFPADKIYSGNQEVNLSSIMPILPIWARNLQVNGQRRFIYPLQEKDFWIRNFANEMKLIAKNRLRENKNPQLGDIPITLNQQLELNIYRTIAKSDLKGDERSVVVADGEGHICAMVDYKPPKYRLDPNDEKKIIDKYKNLYMIGGHGSNEERRCFGSSALLPLLYGTGSTQKPLVYAAVSMGLDLSASNSLSWKDLKLDAIRDTCVDIDSLRDDFLMRKYTGISFYQNNPFRSPKNDEGNGAMVDPLYYLRKSSNYYNSILVYMGTFPSELYSPKRISSFLQIAQSKDETTLFRRVKEPRLMTRQEYQEAWPIMRIGSKPVSFNMSPESVDQNKSLLQQQFEKLFDLSTTFKQNKKTSLYSSISDSILLPYVYPEPSFLDARMRTQRGREFVEKAIRQTATGQRIVWNVTPVMMAQMFARLLPGQAKIQLNIDPNNPHPPYAYLPSADNSQQKTVMNIIYNGMHEVFTSGTANKVYTSLVKDGYLSSNPKKSSPKLFPGKHYWIYGKTGTIGKIAIKGRKVRDNDRLLAVIISDHDLTDSKLKPNDLHYYVIFMSFYNTPASNYEKLQSDIIKRVMSSEDFKKYM